MTEPDQRYVLTTTATARRRFSEVLPESVAAAAWEFVTGPLLEAPRRVGKQLTGPYDGVWSARRGTYRVLYRIDDEQRTVVLLDVGHRRDVYRSGR